VRNTNDFDLSGANKQRHRISDGPSGSAAAVPGDNDRFKLRASRSIWRHDDNWPTGRKQHRFNHGPSRYGSIGRSPLQVLSRNWDFCARGSARPREP
jgi:hypothetical protein